MTSKHFLPSKVAPYLRRLEIEYERAGKQMLLRILRSGSFFVREETEYDNWNGGTYGHDVIIFLPVDVLGEVPLSKQDAVQNEIAEALNKCAAGISNEAIRAVSLELADESDPECQRSIGLSSRPQTNPDTLSIWHPGHIRLFVTHRDFDKKAAKALSEALASFGISAFVAHDTIQPMEDWKKEILKGLETMEVMLVFLTDDFHSSTWTNQEVGYALGRGTPIVTLKLQTADPAGFISSEQALKGTILDPASSVPKILKLLSEKLGQGERLQRAFIAAFAASPDFNEARDRFDRLQQFAVSLSENEVAQIVDAFNSNDQLHKAIYLTNHNNRLINYLTRAAGRDFEIVGGRLSAKKAAIWA